MTTTSEETNPRLYTVVLRAASGCTFSPEGNFTVKGFPTSTGKVTVVFRTRGAPAKDFSKPIPRGLMAEVTGPASSLKTALSAFGQAAQTLLPVLVIVTNAPVGDLSAELAFDSTPGSRERDYFQQFLSDERLLPFERREVPCDLTRTVLEALGRNPGNERLHRAMAHYHEALKSWGSGTEIVALAHLYMAIEVLTPVALRRLLAERKIDRERLVAEWNISIKQLDSEVRRRLLFNGDTDLYDAVKNASDGFEHGYLPFPKIHDVAVAHQEAAAYHVRKAIFSYLELDSSTVDKLLQPPFDRPFSLHFTKYVWGKLLSESDDLASPDQQYPILSWRSDAYEIPSDKGQFPNIGFKDSVTPKLAEGVKFQVEKYEVWGPKLSDETSG